MSVLSLEATALRDNSVEKQWLSDWEWNNLINHAIANHASISWPLCPSVYPCRRVKMCVFMRIPAHIMQKSTTIKWSSVCWLIRSVFISICPDLSWSPEKTLPHDLAGMARMKQHERWAGMLQEKAGVQQPRHWEGLEMWRGSPFVGEVCMWENSQAAQAEVMSGLFSYSSTKKDCVALFKSFITLFIECVGSLLP